MPRVPEARSVSLHVSTVCFTCCPQLAGLVLPVSEISAAATAHGQQVQRDAQGFVESLQKNAPAGSESAVAAWNSVLSAANATYESANKAAKQFVSTVSAVQ